MTQVPHTASTARFGLGQIVRHRDAAFRGVIIDVDPVFAGRAGDTGAVAPDQPFYQILAVGPEGGFIAYAPETVLEHDPDASVLAQVDEERWFTVDDRGHHAPKAHAIH
jgi:heat shock protein HspQ